MSSNSNLDVNRTDILFKKYQGYADTNVTIGIGTEFQANANPFITANKVFTQEIPSIAPNPDNTQSYSKGDGAVGTVSWNSSYPYIRKYTIPLTSYTGNPDVAFVYSNTQNDNILTQGIPSNYDIGGSYSITLSVTGITQIPFDKYIYDQTAGVVSFFNYTTYVSRSKLPTITFWRYEGTIGFNQGTGATGPTGPQGTGATGPTGFISVSGANYGDYVFWNNTTSSWTVGNSKINIGSNAGISSTGPNCVAIGGNAGSSNQGNRSVAIGFNSGVSQGSNCVAVGGGAGNTQGSQSVAIGDASGNFNQGSSCVAIGFRSGNQTQGNECIAIGFDSGSNQQKSNAISIGSGSGFSNQGSQSIAIGNNAGRSNQGSQSIAIGVSAGINNQVSQSIILNADTAALNTKIGTTGGVFISSVNVNTDAVINNVLKYNSSTKEVVYGAPIINDFTIYDNDVTKISKNFTKIVTQKSYVKPENIFLNNSDNISSGITYTFTKNSNTAVKFVAGGVAGDNNASLAYSYDGKFWYPVSGSGSLINTVNGIDYNGRMWIAVGRNTTGTLHQPLISYDGVNWSQVPIGIPFANSVSWGGSSGVWVVTCGIINDSNNVSNPGNSNNIMYSYDGVNWIDTSFYFDRSTGNFQYGFGTSALWNGRLWIATGGTNRDAIDEVNFIAYSYDGIIWKGLGNVIGSSNCFQTAKDGSAIIYKPSGRCVGWNGNLWIVGGTNNNSYNSNMYSYDGLFWFNLMNNGSNGYMLNSVTSYQVMGLSVYDTKWSGNYWILSGDNLGSPNIRISYNTFGWQDAMKFPDNRGPYSICLNSNIIVYGSSTLGTSINNDNPILSYTTSFIELQTSSMGSDTALNPANNNYITANNIISSIGDAGGCRKVAYGGNLINNINIITNNLNVFLSIDFTGTNRYISTCNNSNLISGNFTSVTDSNVISNSRIVSNNDPFNPIFMYTSNTGVKLGVVNSLTNTIVWNAVTLPSPNSNAPCGAITYANKTWLVSGINSITSTQFSYVSFDNGTSWQSANIPSIGAISTSADYNYGVWAICESNNFSYNNGNILTGWSGSKSTGLSNVNRVAISNKFIVFNSSDSDRISYIPFSGLSGSTTVVNNVNGGIANIQSSSVAYGNGGFIRVIGSSLGINPNNILDYSPDSSGPATWTQAGGFSLSQVPALGALSTFALPLGTLLYNISSEDTRISSINIKFVNGFFIVTASYTPNNTSGLYNLIAISPNGLTYNSIYNVPIGTDPFYRVIDIASVPTLRSSSSIVNPILAGGNNIIFTNNGIRCNLAYSYDGYLWNGISQLFLSMVNAINYNGYMYVATGIGSSGFSCIIYSYNGTDWYTVMSNISTLIEGRCVFWYEKLKLWLVGGRGTYNLAYSYDGINWTINSSLIFGTTSTFGCNSIAATTNNIYAVGSSNTGISNIWMSTDGFTWTSIPQIVDSGSNKSNLNSIFVNSSNTIVTTGSSSDGNFVWYSNNEFITRTNAGIGGTTPYTGTCIILFNNTWYATYNNGYIFSGNLTTWNITNVGFGLNTISVYNNDNKIYGSSQLKIKSDYNPFDYSVPLTSGTINCLYSNISSNTPYSVSNSLFLNTGESMIVSGPPFYNIQNPKDNSLTIGMTTFN